MITSVDISRLYNFSFLSKWTSFNGDYKVVGVTVPDSVSDIEDGYKIYSTFFEELGLGVSMYTTYVKSDTTVYICNKVLSYGDEVEYDTNKIFIPGSLIDYETSSMIVEALEYKFVVSNIRKGFSSENEKIRYEQDLQNSMKAELNRNVKFADPGMSVQYAANKIFVSSDELNSIRKEADELNSTYVTSQLEMKNFYETRISDLQKSINYLNSKSDDVYNMLSEYKNLSVAIVGEKGTGSGGLDAVYDLITRATDMSESDKTTCINILSNIVRRVLIQQHVPDYSGESDDWKDIRDPKPGNIINLIDTFDPGSFIVQKTFN